MQSNHGSVSSAKGSGTACLRLGNASRCAGFGSHHSANQRNESNEAPRLVLISSISLSYVVGKHVGNRVDKLRVHKCSQMFTSVAARFGSGHVKQF